MKNIGNAMFYGRMAAVTLKTFIEYQIFHKKYQRMMPWFLV